MFQFDFQGRRLKIVLAIQLQYSVDLRSAIFQARNNIFLFGEKFLIAITPLYQKQLKSRF